MNLKITQWKGRMGNIIIQVKNCIQIALYYNYNIILPENKYFPHKYIVINKNVKKTDKTIIDKYGFYYKNKIKNIDVNLFNKNLDKTKEFLIKFYKFKYNDDFINNYDVLIHIRTPIRTRHPLYILPPLSYYTDLINRNNFKNIVIVSENSENPCINELIRLYPNIKFKINRLFDDVKIILSSNVIIESFGTFCPAILLMSNNIKKIYRPCYQHEFIENLLPNVNNIDIERIDLKEYKNIQYPWICSRKQINCLLTYKKNKEND